MTSESALNESQRHGNRTNERKQILFDTFVTAVEQGIDYWADVREYHWRKYVPETDTQAEDLDGFHAWVADMEDDGKLYIIDDNVIARGINRILSGEVQIRSDLREQVESTRYYDEYDVDADAADCIVQAGLFGEVVYG